MSAVQVAPSGERSQGKGRYGVVCWGNPVWSIHEHLELKFHERRYTSTLYLYLLSFKHIKPQFHQCRLRAYTAATLVASETTSALSAVQTLHDHVRCPPRLSSVIHHWTHDYSVADQTSCPRLRSASTTNYVQPRIWTKFWEQAFSHAGPAAWNSIPDKLRQASFNGFKRNLRLIFLALLLRFS